MLSKIFIFLLFFLILLVNLLIDFSSSPARRCSRMDTNMLLLLHHLLSAFLLFGWMIPDRRVLLLFILGNVLMILEWTVFGVCRLTRWWNRLCGMDDTSPFRDVLWWAGTKDIRLGSTPLTLFHLLAVLFLALGVWHYHSLG